MRSRLAPVTLALLVMVSAAPALAGAQSGEAGRDGANPSGFDLQDALARAGSGDTIVVPPGTYSGPLELDKPVTLVGQGRPVIQGDHLGDVITVSAPDVTIRGFAIQGSGDHLEHEHAAVTGLGPRLTVEDNVIRDALFGVYLKNAPDSVVRGNDIHGMDLPVPRRGDAIRIWYSAGGVIEDNHVVDARDVVIWFSPDVVIRGNVVEGGRYGVHTMFSDDQLVEGNVLRHNSVGAFLMYGRRLTMRDNLLHDNRGPTGYGVGLKDVDDVLAQGNRAVGNRVGFYVDNTPRESRATAVFEHNLIAYNDVGVTLLPLVKRNTYTQNVFLDNGDQISIAGGGQLHENHWSRDGLGNYWSDYAGFDADGSGVGDIPYASQSLYEDLMGKYPKLRLFQLSPATDALDLAAEAFPIFEPRTKITDDHPLMSPPPLPDVPGLPESPLVANVVAALALLCVAGAILTLGAGEQLSKSAGLLSGSDPDSSDG